MISITGNKVITEPEYFEMKEKSQVRHEFIKGKIYEIPGGSMLHENIITNLMRIF